MLLPSKKYNYLSEKSTSPETMITIMGEDCNNMKFLLGKKGIENSLSKQTFKVKNLRAGGEKMSMEKIEIRHLDREIENLREEMQRSANLRGKKISNRQTYLLSRRLDELILLKMKRSRLKD